MLNIISKLLSHLTKNVPEIDFNDLLIDILRIDRNIHSTVFYLEALSSVISGGLHVCTYTYM